MPVVTGYTIIPGVTLEVAPTRILGVIQQADTTTMVIYGQAGSPAELYFSVPAGTTISAGAPELSLTGTNLMLQTTYPASGVANFSFQTGSRRVRILAVSDTLADDTWFVDAGTTELRCLWSAIRGRRHGDERPFANRHGETVAKSGGQSGDCLRSRRRADIVVRNYNSRLPSRRRAAGRVANHERNRPGGSRI